MSRRTPLTHATLRLCSILTSLAMGTTLVGMVNGQELPGTVNSFQREATMAVSCPTGHCPPGRCRLGGCLSPRRLDWNSRYVRRDLPPPGTSLHAIRMTQISNAAAARMMLYQYDFQPRDPRLNPRGNWQLQKMVDRREYHGHPILIEATDSMALDEARRAHVLAVLQDSGTAIDPDDVLISRPLTRGIDGLDASGINVNLLRLSAEGQAGGVGGGAGAGAMGAGGGMGGGSMGNTGRP